MKVYYNLADSGLFKEIKKQLALDDAENGDLIHTTEDNEASDISIITISFVRKTNKQKEIIALEKKSD